MAEISFGDWLKRQRGAVGLTQKQLAQQLNCSLSTVRKLESEERRPSADVVERLMEIYDIPSDKRDAFLRYARGDVEAMGSTREFDLVSWKAIQEPALSNLPLALASFIGRDKEQNEIIALISGNRLVTLTGIGGIGKTQLAFQVGRRVLQNFPQGVWFIPLDFLTDPVLVPQTVASVFDIKPSDNQPVIEILVRVLGENAALLILDNCEHLLDACVNLITTLLVNCPNIKFLATSREILNMRGEAVYQTPSLSMPEQDDEISLEKLTDYDAIRLFAERAALTVSSFSLTEEKVPAVIDICRKIDGIPLAIELAAARVNILQVNEILHQLNDSFALLTIDNQTASTHHQSLQASMDWSWGLLNESEQAFLRQLSIFTGGWTLESAQAVCECEVLCLTDSLVKKSLIVVNQQSGSGTRYRFHEFIRQYSQKKLSETGEDANIRTRHLNYFLQLSKQAEHALKGPAQIEWYARLHIEWSNIRAALAWAEKTDVEAGLYICGRLNGFWKVLGFREARHWIKKFIETPASRNHLSARAKALHAFGYVLFSSTYAVEDGQLLHETVNECLALYRTLGDKQGEIDALILLGSLSYYSSSFPLPQGQDHVQQALYLSKALGDKWRSAFALWNLSRLDLSRKIRPHLLKEAVSLFREIGDLSMLDTCLNDLAVLEAMNMELESAQLHVDEVIQIRNVLQKKGELLNAQSLVEAAKGNFDKAQSILEEGISTASKLGDIASYLWSTARLGHVLMQQGKTAEAQTALFEVTREFHRDRTEIGVVFSLEGMAGVYAKTNKTVLAAQLIGWADAIRKRMKDVRAPLEQADVDKTIASCLATMGESAFADAYEDGEKMSMDDIVAFALYED